MGPPGKGSCVYGRRSAFQRKICDNALMAGILISWVCLALVATKLDMTAGGRFTWAQD